MIRLRLRSRLYSCRVLSFTRSECRLLGFAHLGAIRLFQVLQYSLDLVHCRRILDSILSYSHDVACICIHCVIQFVFYIETARQRSMHSVDFSHVFLFHLSIYAFVAALNSRMAGLLCSVTCMHKYYSVFCRVFHRDYPHQHKHTVINPCK